MSSPPAFTALPEIYIVCRGAASQQEEGVHHQAEEINHTENLVQTYCRDSVVLNFGGAGCLLCCSANKMPRAPGVSSSCPRRMHRRG